ncbi:MAG TPA: DUF6010 family protein [Chitinophagaceae bacterium]|jgi:hypothetical protein|nr:DUF6010 family protein [Chitinophagaceae bacterium]
MTAAFIGTFSGILVILMVALLKQLDKATVYGLILAGIGYLYVGFTWSDIPSLVITFLQSVAFLFLAFFGIKKNIYFLTAGYFLHGLWDLLYDLFPNRGLIPPHYDWFCLSIDFTIGLYLLLIRKQLIKQSHEAVH